MPKSKLKRGEIKEQTAVKIPFEHLSAAAKQIIGRTISLDAPGRNYDTIKSARVERGFSEMGMAFGLGLQPFTDYNKAVAAIGLLSAGGRIIASRVIQDLHWDLKTAINKHGLLDTKFEGHYPFNWMSSAFVAKTHPVFYVTGRGDLVFKKPTRLEYMRYLDQKRWYGKVGLTPWRWRVYLEPPQAPEKVRMWAREKLAALVRRPALEPAFVPARRRNSAKVSK